jgi:hypothetical protein
MFALGTAVMTYTGCGTVSDTTDDTTGDSAGDSCSYTANTTETSTVNSYGCALLTRDTSSCRATREAAGLSSFWLDFSCAVDLSKSGSTVTISTEGIPDYKSYYFGSTNACYEDFDISGRDPNPGSIAAVDITMGVPYSPAPKSGTKTTTSMGAIGVSVNGVVIFNNEAGPDDNIYDEVATFDQCEGHPAMTTYHYHIEPAAISNNDSNFIGVMRDGFPIYGKKDANGSTPTLDAYGGHTGSLPNDTSTTLYHYHLQSVTGTDGDGNSATAYFLMTDEYNGTPGTTCTNCVP